MRVIAGELRGRPIDAPPGNTTRPMTDRVKETIFNILGGRLAEPGSIPPVAVLDLFAGSGGLGIEALSRGAASCVFVERDRGALATLRGNLGRLRLGERARVSSDNAWTLRPPEERKFGLIFVDPPYRDMDEPRRGLDLLDRLAPGLAEGGLIVLRTPWRAHFPIEELMDLVAVDDREVGDMRIVFLAHRPPVELPAPEPLTG